MGENSGIEWTHHTFNPWIGCTKISPACDNCYAEAYDKRYGGEHWGPKAERRRTAFSNWNNPRRWNRQAENEGIRLRVFCASLADVFDNAVPVEWRNDLWTLISETPNLDWLLLTKRPQNIAKMLPLDWHTKINGCYENVWLGTTVENEQEADRRIPHLIDVKAAVHFLSCEPLLGPVNISMYLSKAEWRGLPGWQSSHEIDWVIAGGESGPNARPSNPEWYRSLRDQCIDAGVPFLFKQWGEYVSVSEVEGSGQHYTFDDGRTVRRVGKKAAGRTLDGILWDEYPKGANNGRD